MLISPPLGAHVSIAGGFAAAAERAHELDATAMQIFTKAPQRWADRTIETAEAEEFRSARAARGVRIAAAHDSYLINLATADPALLDRSFRAFVAELSRAETLGLEYVVTHPGNPKEADRGAALSQNARLIVQALDARPGDVRVLIETTAGAGTSLGCSFEEIAAMLDHVPARLSTRVGVCLDTAHLFAAGYDLRADYEGTMRRFDEIVGLERLGMIHCNDSVGTLGSRLDRHAAIGEGELGEAPFRQLMRDERLRDVARVIETPKGDDPVAADRRNLSLLATWAAPCSGESAPS